jgi:hypothetical protein
VLFGIEPHRTIETSARFISAREGLSRPSHDPPRPVCAAGLHGRRMPPLETRTMLSRMETTKGDFGSPLDLIDQRLLPLEPNLGGSLIWPGWSRFVTPMERFHCH